MNPFNQNPDQNPGRMPDQNDLIAYHLHQLSPHQERALRRSLQSNTVLALESAAIAETLLAFPKNELTLPIDTATLERHWLALRPSLALHFPQPSAPRTLFRGWALPALAGSALAALALLIALHHGRHAPPLLNATIAAPSSTVSTLASPAGSQPDLSSSVRPHVSNPRPQTIHGAWPSSSMPLEAATPKASPPFFPAESPAPLAPNKPSSAVAETSATEGALSLPTTTAQTQPPAEPSSQASTQPSASRRRSTVHRLPPVELTLGIFGDLTASRSSTYTTGSGTSLIAESLSQTATSAVGALASFRQQLRPWLGYRVTATYTGPTFIDSYKPSSSTVNQSAYGGLTISHRIYEFSGTYVVQGPHHRRLTTSAEAGAGVLDILSSDPTDYPTTNTHALRPAAVIGVGSELTLTRHWGLRAEYRALLYKPPAFASAMDGSVPPGSLTFSSNPILGITYRLGGKGGND
jgi:hypothetical protein